MIGNWYLAARSSQVRTGQVRACRLGELELAVYRGSSGQVSALSAHCSHLGTHLARGRVVGDCLRCPLHHWDYAATGECLRIPGRDSVPSWAAQRSYPVVEHEGGVFVGTGEGDFPPLPAGPASVGRPLLLECPWQAVAANGFDLQHLGRVHGRRLEGAPEVYRNGEVLRIDYRSQVIGEAVSDRVTRWLAGDRIQVRLTSYRGTLVLMESQLGRHRAWLLVSLLPLGPSRCQAWPIYGLATRRGPGRWLVERFLAEDLRILEGIAWDPRLLLPEDAQLAQMLDFIAGLDARPQSRDSQTVRD